MRVSCDFLKFKNTFHAASYIFAECNFYALQMHAEFAACSRYFMYIVEGFYLVFPPSQGLNILYLWVFLWARKTRIKCKFVPSFVCAFCLFRLLCVLIFCCHVSASGDNLNPYLEQVYLHTTGLFECTCVYL